MPGRSRGEAQLLVQEARAMELFANDIEVPPEFTERYWSASADLINLVVDIESFASQHVDVPQDDPELLLLRRRLRVIGATLSELSLE